MMATGSQGAGQRRATVSVLLCNYNDSRFLPESLDAIFAQTRIADEIIIVDDGSTDDSREVIARYTHRHPNVRVLKNETNQGLMYSIAHALDAATMDYVVWAASDDVLLPDFLARNMAMLERYPEAVMSFSMLATFDDQTGEIVEYTSERFKDAFDLGDQPRFMNRSEFFERLGRSYVWMSGNTVVVRRDVLVKFGAFYPDLRWHADWYTYYMIGLRNGSCIIPETLAMMRSRGGTFSGAGMRQRSAQQQVLNRIIGRLLALSNRDLYWIVVRRPCILSPFGKHILFAALRDPRAWPIAVQYGIWLTRYWMAQRFTGRVAIKRWISRLSLSD